MPPVGPCSRGIKLLFAPWPPRVACESSTEKASHALLLIFFDIRKPYCRAQLKPTLYCGSMVIGNASERLSTPFFVSVIKLHICPPVKLQPLFNAACAQACRTRSP